MLVDVLVGFERLLSASLIFIQIDFSKCCLSYVTSLVDVATKKNANVFLVKVVEANKLCLGQMKSPVVL